MADLKQAVDKSNNKTLSKLLHFAAPVPATRQYLQYKSDQAISLVKFVILTSDGKDMFNFFTTVSAAALNWEDLHRLLPNAKETYLGKRL